MKSLETVLRKEMLQHMKVAENARKRLVTAPKGQLRISRKRDGVEYYYKEKKKDSVKERVTSNTAEHTPNGRYMKKSEFDLVKKIAQRDYDEAVLKFAEKRVKAIERFLKEYERTSLKQLYRNTNRYRKELIVPAVISDEEYVERWLSEEYKGKNFEDEENMIFTERGERVRSKSEKIIADKLYGLGIPYRYEYPLVLDGNVTVYPDFTILRMPEREEVYLEHFGMMDHPEYVEKVLYKLNTYERNGIYLGVNLFVTYETGARPLNTKNLDRMIRMLFKEEA